MKKLLTSILPLIPLVGTASSDEEITKKIIWDNGEFDTVPLSGSISTVNVGADDFKISRNTVIGSLTVWAHDAKELPEGGFTPLGELDSLDAFTGTLTVAFYQDGGEAPGTLITT